MEIVKNNIVSIILGVIALVALTTPLWLLPSYKGDLESKARASQSTASNINALLTKERMKPGVDLAGQPTPLEQFPNENTIAAGKALQQEVANTATEMLNRAIEMNRRSVMFPGLNDVVLVPDALPQQRNNGAFDFRNRYAELARNQVLARQLLNAGTPPTKEDIDQEIKILQDRIMARRRTFPGGGDNLQELQAEFQQQSLLVAPRLIAERAASLRMYVDTNAFNWHQAIRQAQETGQAPNPVQTWQAQLGLWLQTAFARAIADANAQAKNVHDAVVKRLLRIEFAENPYVLQTKTAPAAGSGYDPYDEFGMTPGMGSDMMGGSGMAMAPASEGDPSAPLPKDYTKSLTGRVSNPMYDVVHFRAVLHVDHARLPLFLRKLGENRLMYVRTMHIEAIDPVGLQIQGYVYGPDPVVEVTLEMEMLFMRAWTLPLMPDPVRVSLGLPA